MSLFKSLELGRILLNNKKGFEIKTFNIQVVNTTPEFGTLTVNKTVAKSGEIITISVSPNTGYEVESLNISPEVKLFSKYKFRMPAEDVILTVSFRRSLNNIFTFCQDTKCGTLKSDKSKATMGDTVTLTLDLNEGYTFSHYTCSPSSVIITDNKFIMPAENVYITACTTASTYNIASKACPNGAISCDTTAKVGNLVTFKVMPANDNYKLATITTSPSLVITNNQFTMPASNVSITATFVLKSHKITCLSADEGKLCASQEYADKGEEINLYPAGTTGYKFVDYVTEDPITISNHKFIMPDSDVTIGATYTTQFAGTGCYYKFVDSENTLYMKGTLASGYSQYTGSQPILGSYEQNSKIKYLSIDDTTTLKLPASCVEMFAYSSLTASSGSTYIDFNSFDTSNVTSMECMFASTKDGTGVFNMNGWDTSKVTSMNAIFGGCGATNLILKDWNVSAVTDLFSAFTRTDKILYINLENWTPTNCIDVSRMFEGSDTATNTRSINMKLFTWEGTCDTEYMFSNCTKLITLYCNNPWKGKCKVKSEVEGPHMFNNTLLLNGDVAWKDAKVTDATYARWPNGYFTAK